LGLCPLRRKRVPCGHSDTFKTAGADVPHADLHGAWRSSLTSPRWVAVSQIAVSVIPVEKSEQIQQSLEL
jgi:hypothetical protein